MIWYVPFFSLKYFGQKKVMVNAQISIFYNTIMGTNTNNYLILNNKFLYLYLVSAVSTLLILDCIACWAKILNVSWVKWSRQLSAQLFLMITSCDNKTLSSLTWFSNWFSRTNKCWIRWISPLSFRCFPSTLYSFHHLFSPLDGSCLRLMSRWPISLSPADCVQSWKRDSGKT